MPPKWMHSLLRRWMLFALVALLTACSVKLLPPPPTSLAAGYTLSGTVTRGQSYSQNLAPTLTFQLIPTPSGWEIWVGDPTHSMAAADNFAFPVTPPFTGINARQLDGWHFRNRDNTAPNAAGDKNVNAPQAARPFCFVSSPHDFQRALTAYAAGLPALSDAIHQNAFPIHSGLLQITHYTLGNLQPDQPAWFEQIEFTVTLNLDQPCPLF